MWLGGIVAIFGLYLFYLPFDDWWYLRFLMPMFPALFVLTSVVLLRVVTAGTSAFSPQWSSRRWPGTARVWPLERGASHVWQAEQRYAEAGAYVASPFPSAPRCSRCSTVAALASIPAASRCGTTSLDGTTSIVCSAI